MKQYIGYSEFKSLTSEQFIKIAELHYNEMYPTKKDFHLVKQDCYDAYDKSKDYWFGIQEWLTIGKMIEILEVEYDVDLITLRKDVDKDRKNVRIYGVICSVIGFSNNQITYKSIDKVDALFEAVKEVL